MNTDISALSMIAELTPEEFDTFKNAVRALVSKTFIIRGVKKEEGLYGFVIRNIALFDAFFLCMDASVLRDESLGVISFRGQSDTRLRLNLEETCALLVARVMYEEKRADLSLTRFPVITVEDFVQKYGALTGAKLNKTRLSDTLRRLQTHKLIDINSAEISDAEGTMILYPSIAMTVDHDSIDDMLSALRQQ
ncbi:MAG: DUF4194 domain-containing protein [Spirochaetaceae bacterium]|jgi:hypothetical protein|nr:DUF4194 domain-containing protein [Spirochaetaceae bacterium]